MKQHTKFIETYRKYVPFVFNAIYAKIGNIQETEDLCQEIFTYMYNKFNEIETPRKWLFGTIRNTLLKYYRDRKINVTIDTIFDDVSLTYVNGFKDTRLLLKDIINEVTKDDDEKMLIELIAVHNYSYRHAARAMGLTYKAVLYRYNKIVEKVLTKLKERGIESLEELL